MIIMQNKIIILLQLASSSVPPSDIDAEYLNMKLANMSNSMATPLNII